MSLINQMLKDLAKRSRPLTSPDMIVNGLMTSSNKKPDNRNIYHYLLLALSAVSILFLLTSVYYRFSIKPAHQIKNINAAADKIKKLQTSPLHASDLVSTPVELTGITMQVENGMTNLRFMLTKHALYHVIPHKNNIEITLENARLVTTLPQIDTLNSAIKMMRIINLNDGNLKILFKLNRGAVLSHLNLNDAGKLSELQVDIDQKSLRAAHTNDEAEDSRPMSHIKKVSYDTSIEEKYQQALSFFNSGENDKAEIALSGFLKKHPEHAAARESLVTLLLKEGDLIRAQQIIDAGLRKKPFYLPYIQLKAQVLVSRGKIKNALDLLQSKEPSLEENPDYYALIAALYQQESEFALAEKLYERLLKVEPDNAIWWMGLGITREGLGSRATALTAYQNANSGTLNPELKVYVENRIRLLL